MFSTYITGVFLVISTYNGPQLVYHFYDDGAVAGKPELSDFDSEGEIEWSEELSTDEDESSEASMNSSKVSAPLDSPYTQGTTSALEVPSLRNPTSMASGEGMSAPLRPDADQEIWSKQSTPGKLSSSEPVSPQPSNAPSSSASASIAPSQVTSASSSMLPAGLDKEILAEILTPPTGMCNERFSLTIDNIMLVGIPVHILENGTWRPLKTTKLDPNDDVDAKDSTFSESQNLDADKEVDLKGITTSKDSPMRMFHVCFALKPPITEANNCEERIYRHVLVPFIRMLRHEQASKNYVWNQVSEIIKAREQLRAASIADQQEAVETQSELARALKNLCTAVSHMEIARIMIANKVRAFQVPLQLELTDLPLHFDEVSPHAYLTTTNAPSKEIGHDCHECYGLLLLDDPEIIVQEIEVDPQGPVAAMIRNITPTSSIEELARRNKIDIKQIVTLVWSLVYWRRARIIIPLNSRYTYSISPMAPFGSNYNDLVKSFHEAFPMMPPLPRILSMLSSGKPKPYALHIPSNDHRGIYVRALAWLLQNDFVVHLPTFALVVVTRKIKLASASNEEMNTEMEQAISDGEDTNESPHKIVSSEHSRAVSESMARQSMSHRRLSSYHFDLDDVQDSVIQDPLKPSLVEKQWLAQVAVSGASRNPDLATMFYKLTKYFNGRDCLEQVMIREHISREEMRRFLQEFSQNIVTYRHW